nr:hypothetical protein BSM_12460 [uncultured archaeon]
MLYLNWLPYFNVIGITTSLARDIGCKRKVACLPTTQFKPISFLISQLDFHGSIKNGYTRELRDGIRRIKEL